MSSSATSNNLRLELGSVSSFYPNKPVDSDLIRFNTKDNTDWATAGAELDRYNAKLKDRFGALKQFPS